MSASRSSRRQPVVAIDFDGVLNRLVEDDAIETVLKPGWVDLTVEVEAHDLPSSPFIRGFGEHDLTLPLRVNPGLHAPWITDLRDRADVVWATLWDRAANVVLAPVLGIEPLPIGISVDVQLTRFGDAINGDITGCKSYALDKAFAGRPLVWIDDMTGSHARGWFSREGQPTSVVTCDPAVGLTRAQMDEVDAWVDALGIRRG